MLFILLQNYAKPTLSNHLIPNHAYMYSLLSGACVVLHNVAFFLKEPLPQDDLPGQDDAGDVGANQPADEGKRVRDYLTRTFFCGQ